MSKDGFQEQSEKQLLEDWNTFSLEKKKNTPTEEVKEEQPQEPVLRAPICCVLGHVDTGKTKLLDAIRQTSVQEGEAGGITQQIGATYFPVETLRQKTGALGEKFTFVIPGLLVIDTPGHESFTNLRARGSSLCNIAILVVDLMHGLEPQTREALSLLRVRKTPFIVALNKIDRLYGWKSNPQMTFKKNLSKQSSNTQSEFEDRLSTVIGMFAEEGMNAELFVRNKDIRKAVSLIPTSAITCDGLSDLLLVVCTITQKLMTKALLYVSSLECTVLEVKVVEGLGMTIDVILSNGQLHEGDTIIVCGASGPLVTSVRALLTPQPLRELRVKAQYVHNKQVTAALGVKIFASGLEGALAGGRLLVANTPLEIEKAKDEIEKDLESVLHSLSLEKKGVTVQASTLGSLEALLSFLQTQKVPCMKAGIGVLYKKDIIPATLVETEHAVVLCFDVKIDTEALELASHHNVKIFSADIIYNLFDMFCTHRETARAERKAVAAKRAIFPCLLKIVPNCIFNKKDPIILGVEVLEGSLHLGTPLCVPGQQNILFLGHVSSIEANHKPLSVLHKSSPSAAIKITIPGGTTPMAGRHFDEKATLVSQITRMSIDVLKENFRDDLSKEDWLLIKNKLKPLLGIQ